MRVSTLCYSCTHNTADVRLSVLCAILVLVQEYGRVSALSYVILVLV